MICPKCNQQVDIVSFQLVGQAICTCGNIIDIEQCSDETDESHFSKACIPCHDEEGEK